MQVIWLYSLYDMDNIPINESRLFDYFKDLMDVAMCLERMYQFADGYFGLLFYFLALFIPSMLFPRMPNDLPRLISDSITPCSGTFTFLLLLTLKSYKASKLVETDYIKYDRIALFRFLKHPTWIYNA